MSNAYTVSLSLKDESIVGPLKTLCVSHQFNGSESEEIRCSVICDITKDLIESWKNLSRDKHIKESYLEE